MILLIIGIAGVAYALSILFKLPDTKPPTPEQKKTTNKMALIMVISGAVMVTGICMRKYPSHGDSTITASTNKKNDLSSNQKVQDFLQGKWHWEEHTGGPNEVYRYRAEITGYTLKFWLCVNNMDDPFEMNEPKTHDFTIGSPTRDIDGNPCRYLEFDESNVSLQYRAISPIWIRSYKDALRITNGSGVFSWNKGWE